MNRAYVIITYLVIVWLGSVLVHFAVNEHRFNVALKQLKQECKPFGSEDLTLTYICNGQLVRVGDRMREMVEDDGSL